MVFVVVAHRVGKESNRNVLVSAEFEAGKPTIHVQVRVPSNRWIIKSAREVSIAGDSWLSSVSFHQATSVLFSEDVNFTPRRMADRIIGGIEVLHKARYTNNAHDGFLLPTFHGQFVFPLYLVVRRHYDNDRSLSTTRRREAWPMHYSNPPPSECR